MIEAQRAKLWGCYFLTRSKLFSASNTIGKLLSGTKGEALFKRITTDLMKNCLNKIQPADSENVFKTLNNEDFNIDNYNHLLGFNAASYEGDNVKTELEADEKFIHEYYTKIDDSFREQREEQAEKEDKARRQKMDYEPQIGGLSLKETSPFVKLVYTAVVAGTIIVIFLFAYKKLFTSEETPYEKLKRQKAEKKKAKTQ
jgi:cell division protein FtsL